MRTKQLARILNWFATYQPDLEGGELYDKLIQEEKQELREAWDQQDLTEILDAIVDIMWVEIGKLYFTDDNCLHLYNKYAVGIDRFRIFLNCTDNQEAFRECLQEVINSNYTKILETQTEGEKAGKVIKGPNFKAPDFTEIIEKYNITLK